MKTGSTPVEYIREFSVCHSSHGNGERCTHEGSIKRRDYKLENKIPI